jgi:AraC-like DNA-binding protein
VIAYHYVIEGRMLVMLEGEPGSTLEARAGETVLLPRNEPHVLASAPGLAPVSADDLVQPPQPGSLARIVHGGSGELTRIACGFLGNDRDSNPLIDSLPRLLKVDMSRSGDWIESSLRLALRRLAEGEVGTSTLMARLSELMFVEAVRSYAASLPAAQRGWVAGLRDPAIGRALALVHRDARQAWTAEALAREVALSRSAFTDRFTALVGVPPGRYATRWRLQVAKDKLRDPRRSIAQIAFDAGYDAAEAFNRAFKREFGLPPAAWRRHAQPPA